MRYQTLWWIIAIIQMVKGRGIKRIRNKYGKFHIGDTHALIQFSFVDKAVREVMAKYKGLVIDIGANIGTTTMVAVKAGATVIAMEPAKKTFELLKENVKANREETKVKLMNMAAWNKNGKLHLKYDKQLALREVANEGEEINAITIDSLNVKPILIKIDVEGHTIEVIEGCENTIKLHKPDILFEARPDYNELQPVKSKLEERGYKLTKVNASNWLASA